MRLVFKLPLRQAEGFLRSVLALMALDLEAPDHTTLSRRSQSLNVHLHRVAGDNPTNLIVDSTGLSIVGEGEWAAAKYGGLGRRGWKKLHLSVDRTGAIVTQTLTHGSLTPRECVLISSMTLRASRPTQPMTPSRSTLPAPRRVPKSSSHLREVRRNRVNEDLGLVPVMVRF